MILNRTKRKIVILLTFTILAVTSYTFLVLNINKKSDEIYEMSQKISDAQAKEKNLLSMQKNLSVSRDKIAELSSFVIKADVDSQVLFIKKIEDLAIASNVESEIKSTKIEQISSKDSVTAEYFTIDLNAIGTFSDVIFFLKRIENLPYKIKINNVSIDKFADYETKGKNIPQWSLYISFSVLKLK